MPSEYIYTDLHIHTSENPDFLGDTYDIQKLLEKVSDCSRGNDFLISLTDHNTINKRAYEELDESKVSFIVGAELHIRNTGIEPYHCHIYFKHTAPLDEFIDGVNAILDERYKVKKIENCKEATLPSIEEIVTDFDKYEFMLIPHGGQEYRAFHKSLAQDTRCDTAVLRSIYYNQFEGFSSRNTKGTEETISYFEKLGIASFVNLITGSDNYSPSKYPASHSGNDGDSFMPTWMNASPNFDGLRLALSESSRLKYQLETPNGNPCSVESVKLSNTHVDIDVVLSSGLNVVIGGSSCGKTLFVDSLARKLGFGDGRESAYQKYGIGDMEVCASSKRMPHYINQNYILKVIDPSLNDYALDQLDIIKTIFPEDSTFFKASEKDATSLRKTVERFVQSIDELDKVTEALDRIDDLSNLVVLEKTKGNPLASVLPKSTDRDSLIIDEEDYGSYIESLNEVKTSINKSLFAESCDDSFSIIINSLSKWRELCEFEALIYSAILGAKASIDSQAVSMQGEKAIRTKEFSNLLEQVEKYTAALKQFENTSNEISKWHFRKCSESKVSNGHTLTVENRFDITSEIFSEEVRNCYPATHTLSPLKDLCVSDYFVKKTKKRDPKITSYDDLKNTLLSGFEERRKRTYNIITSEGKDWSTLSAGWKTAILLDLILGYTDDHALLIVDQPEDNLSSTFINTELMDALKRAKHLRQIIVVTHNATIPMLADAQTIVLCQENNSQINIRSGILEGEILGKKTLDWVAEVTDGGKKAIRKRVKKYAMKDYVDQGKREIHESQVL